MYRLNKEKGAALILTFIILISLTLVVLAFGTMMSYEMRNTGAQLRNMQAFYIAEAGLAKARWALTTGEEDLGWTEEDVSFGEGTYTVATVDNGDDTCTITSEGYIPDDTNPIAQRRVIERNIAKSTSATNFSLAAVATASSEQAINTADKSNDGDILTNWKSTVNNGSWLKHDFGSAVAFDQIVYDGTKISAYDIKYSNDDVAYNSVTNPVESPAGTVTFDAVSARYLRFDVDGKRPEVNELETYNTSDVVSVLGQGDFVTAW